MTNPDDLTFDALPLSAEKRVDDACLRFENEWKAGRRPRVEDFLPDVGGAERLAFLRELILVEIGYRQRLGENPRLEEYVERFVELDAADLTDLFLQRPDSVAPPTESSARNLVFAGRYTLLEKIGEGGMGEVWIAKQSEPVKRKVAVKLIKAGMDSKAVMQRFELERQALALMDHPNIAKVLDGGLTDDRRPYFVMELVNGQPLTKYCDDAKLTPRQRLELFVPVCQAVQHAHQKGIVHRDLKPSNILISVYDGRPVPKVIDFGVAKAISGKLTDESLSTQFGAVVGTLEYMSPEQAGFSIGDVDTRTDIYSLGVILYELLTGLRPLDASRLKKAAFTEMVRIIQEEEPSKPSTRLSTNDSLPSLAALRQIEPKKLTAMLRRELDWVVMKCLEKNRDRRYETANGLARDIQRYLADESVEARPPTAGYRLRKLLKRNRGPAIAASMVLLALIAGIIGTTWGLIRAEHQRRVAERAQADEAEQRRVAETAQQRAEQAEAETLADYRASTDDAIEQLIGSKPELGPQETTYLENTLLRWQTFANRKGEDERSRATRAEGYYNVALLWGHLGQKETARSEYETARDIWMQLVQQFPQVPLYRQQLGRTRNNLGDICYQLERRAEARIEYESALDIQKQLVAQFPSHAEYRQELARTHNNLGIFLSEMGNFDAATIQYQTSLDLRKKLADDFPEIPLLQFELANSRNDFGNYLAHNLGEAVKAREQYEAARAVQQRLVERFPKNPMYQANLATIRDGLGVLFEHNGAAVNARNEYFAARDIWQKLTVQFPVVPDYPSRWAASLNRIGDLLRNFGKNEEARNAYLQALDLQKKLVDRFPNEPIYQKDLAYTLHNLGTVLKALGKLEESQKEYEAARVIRKSLADQFPTVHRYRQNLATTHGDTGLLFVQMNKMKEAQTEYEAALEIDQKLVEQYPEVPLYYQELSVVHNNIGLMFLYIGKLDKAKPEFEESVAALRKLVERFPNIRLYQVQLGGAYGNVGSLYHQQRKLAEAVPWFDRSIQTLKAILDAEPRDAVTAQFLQNGYWNRALVNVDLERHNDAIRDLGLAMEVGSSDKRLMFRARRALSQIALGRNQEAIAEFTAVSALADNPAETQRWEATDLYNFACIYSIASGKIADKKQEYAVRAIELLRKTIRAGFPNPALIKTDSDFDPIRNRDDFKKFLAEVEPPAKPSGVKP